MAGVPDFPNRGCRECSQPGMGVGTKAVLNEGMVGTTEYRWGTPSWRHSGHPPREGLRKSATHSGIKGWGPGIGKDGKGYPE
jgi:hypothetical protein